MRAPYVPTGALFRRRNKTGDATFTGWITITPALIDAAGPDGRAPIYFVRNPERATDPSQPAYIAYVASQCDENK
jgi:hypothetical protein